MGGICGIIHRDGAPVSSEDFRDMQQAMAFWGRAGIRAVESNAAAFACFLQGDTPEETATSLPVATDDYVFTATARLDNREALLRTFDLPEPEHANTSDADLLLQAWLRWGEACAEHLYGDWCYAVWDKHEQTLRIVRDQFGVTALYYYVDENRIAFASSMKGLLALPFVPKRPNMVRIAQVLVAWMGDGSLTGYEAIFALPTSRRLMVSPTLSQVEEHWRPREIPPRNWPSVEAFMEEFLETYTEAVRCRLRTSQPVAATLSGGFDSGSVVALGGPLLAAEGRGLAAYTSVPKYDPSARAGDSRMGDEWEDAHATALLAGVAQHQRVDAGDVSIVAAISDMVQTLDTPGHAATNYFWLWRIMETAKQEGAGVLLTGQYGNASVSFSGTGAPWQYVRRGQWGALLESIRTSEPSVALWFKRHIIKPLLYWPPAWVRSKLPSTRRARFLDTAIRMEFVEQLQLPRLMRESGTDLAAQPRFGVTPRHWFYVAGMGIGNQLWAEMAADNGLSVRDPTADRRLVELCCAAPDHYFRRKGMHRWLLRQVMRGRMPQSVLQYKKKGIQAADMGYRIREEATQFRALLDQFEQHALTRQVLDLPRMRALLDELAHDVSPKNAERVGLTLCVGVGVGLFLARFQD